MLLDRYAITVFIDVGANSGQTGEEIRRFGWGGEIVSFEPLSAPFSSLRAAAAGDDRWQIHQLALGDVNAEAEMTVTSNEAQSSSLLAVTSELEQLAGIAAVGTESVRLGRLDDVTLPAGPYYLKIDVQGSELSVLRGASSTLRQAAVVETEVSLKRLYERQPLLPEVTDALRSEGYALVELRNGFRDVRSGDLLELDAFFVRPTPQA